MENKYLEAVNTVCMDCCGNEQDCISCKVRKTVDKMNNAKLSDYEVTLTVTITKIIEDCVDEDEAIMRAEGLIDTEDYITGDKMYSAEQIF